MTRADPAISARDFGEDEIRCFEGCLRDFPDIQALKKEQEICLVNLARGRDIFADFDFKLFSVPEVQQALQKINPKKSSGWDSRISPKLLKSVAEGTAASLTRLYNNCIEQGEWPNAWKMGEWTPAYKKGDRQDTTSYRPITSLTAVDKIFEQLLCNQVTCHYDKTLYNRMTAYRKKHSCETTLLALIEDWKLAADTKQLVYILSTDMSKAFDSLSHSLTIN